MERELKSHSPDGRINNKKLQIKAQNLLEHCNEIAATFNSMPSQIIWYRNSLNDNLHEISLEDIFEQKSLATESPQPSN